jgi:hypothetical protein
MLSELCVLQVHLASGYADGASYGLERAFEPPRLARPQRGRAARPTIGSAGDPSLGRAGPGVSAVGSELRPRANQSWYAVTLAVTHTVSALSRLQTPPRLCSLPTVMCAHCVCATGTGRRRRGRGRRSTHSWSCGTTPRLHGSGTRILEPAAHLMTYDDLSDGFPLMASLARCAGCRISNQLPGIYHDRRFLAGKGYRAYWRRCGAVNRPGAVECFGPPRICGENSERGCAWAERQWRPL